MISLPPLSEEFLFELDSLSTELLALGSRRPADALIERRRLVLARHLGHEPPQDIGLLHCIGDSHCLFFGGAENTNKQRVQKIGIFRRRWINRAADVLPCFRTWHLGPATAFKAVAQNSTVRTYDKIQFLLKKHIPPKSKILLSFGEIDCRVHLARMAKQDEDVEAIITRTVDAFLVLPRELKSRGYTPIVWGPATVSPRAEALDIGDFPFVGTPELRLQITNAYLDILKQACQREEILMPDFFHTWYKQEKQLEFGLLADGVHLSQRLMPLALKMLLELHAFDVQ